jgi:tRNA (adenine37-N6)-methyltransferase
MAPAVAEFSLKAIGHFKGHSIHKSAIPRQGYLSEQTGEIYFEKGFDSKAALQGLEKMSHVWVLFRFHDAKSKPKPLVRPPRNPDIQVGVWATRSPYRPNSIGLSLVKIEKIENGRLFISQVDLLDQTPIFDLKPYIPESDSVKNPQLGWIGEVQNWKYSLKLKARKQMLWLKANGLIEIEDLLISQFGTPPLQSKRKRVQKLDSNHYILSYRTWRFHFKLNLKKHLSEIENITSGYSQIELEDSKDPYLDKKLHQKFNSLFHF